MAYNGDSDPLLDDTGEKRHIKFPSCRHVLSFMGFLGFVNVYALRVNLSVALVAMVNQSYNAVPASNNSQPECPGEDDNNSTISTQQGEFNWDSNLQGLILGAFFYGYITTQIPGGWLAEKFGGKKLFGFGVLCTAALTLVTPVVVRWNTSVFIAVRIIEGIGEGVTFPAMHAMLGKWAPKFERSKLSTAIYAGAQFGTVVSLPISGWLCGSSFLGGWPSVFYLFGALGCLWFVAWMLLVYDTPAAHPRISEEEREYIETSIGHEEEEKLPTPWLEFAKSLPVWGIIFGHFANNWGFYTLLTCLPTYMKEVLKFDIKSNGLLSALPYLAIWAIINIGGQCADYIRTRKILSTTNVRKIFQFFGLILPAIFLVVAGYVGCNPPLAVTMITLAVGTSGLALSGFMCNHLDIAPPFAGTLLGITNGIATIPGFAGPAVVGLLTNNNPSRQQWQIVFFISAGVYVLGAIVFSLLASGKEQEWAKPEFFLKKKSGHPKHTQISADDILSFGQNASPTYHSTPNIMDE